MVGETFKNATINSKRAKGLRDYLRMCRAIWKFWAEKTTTNFAETKEVIKVAHNPSKSSLGLVFSKCGNTPAGVEIPGWFSVGHCERLDGRINQIFPARYTSIYLYLLVFCIYPNTVIICIYTHREISIVFFTTSAIYIYIYIY